MFPHGLFKRNNYQIEPRRFEGKVLINEDTFHRSATSHSETTTMAVITGFAYLNSSHTVFRTFMFVYQDWGGGGGMARGCVQVQ
jgi:hypothetical protein